MNLIPPDDRVLLRQLPAETVTAFGLELPEQAQERPLRAIVLAVGKGTPHPLGDAGRIPLGDAGRIPLGEHIYAIKDYDREGQPFEDRQLWPLEPGDEVVLPRYGGTEIEAEDGETVISILAHEILAVVG